MDAVVINERNDTNNLRIGLTDLFLNQVIADQIADCFGSILIADTGDTEIERGE